MWQIDLNADLGEGCSDDAAIIPLLSSANISCGAHAGSTADIRAALACCKLHQVVIGAHPAYPDPAHFGRRSLDLPWPELQQSLFQQLIFLQTQAADVGCQVQYLKLHGALYNDAAANPELASHIVSFIQQFAPKLALLTLPNSALFYRAKDSGLRVFAEAFADRAYQANGQLLSRQHAGALLDAKQAIKQSLQLVLQGHIEAIDGTLLSLQADSLCLHGDCPQALALAQHLHQALSDSGVKIQSFARRQA